MKIRGRAVRRWCASQQSKIFPDPILNQKIKYWIDVRSDLRNSLARGIVSLVELSLPTVIAPSHRISVFQGYDCQ